MGIQKHTVLCYRVSDYQVYGKAVQRATQCQAVHCAHVRVRGATTSHQTNHRSNHLANQVPADPL